MLKVLRLFDIVQVPAKVTTLLFAGVVFHSLLTTRASADYVYDIVNYAPLQNGWTLSGQITTDINNGSLTQADVLSWNWSVTNGTQSYTFASTDTPVSQAFITGTVIATPSAIEIPIPLTNENHFGLEDGNFPPYDQLGGLVYTRAAANVLGPTPTDVYESVQGIPYSNVLWNGSAPPFPLDPTSGPDDPWVVATATPEPATVTLLASGVLAFGGFGLHRRRRTPVGSRACDVKQGCCDV